MWWTRIICLFAILPASIWIYFAANFNLFGIPKETEICKFLKPIAEYNLEKAHFISKDILYNLVHPKTGKSITIESDSKQAKYHLDERQFVYHSNYFDKGCECLERLSNETENPGLFLEIMKFSQCLTERCFNDWNGEAIERYLEATSGDADEFCKNATKIPFCKCIHDGMNSLFEEVFPLNNEQTENHHYKEEEQAWAGSNRENNSLSEQY